MSIEFSTNPEICEWDGLEPVPDPVWEGRVL